MLAATHRFHRRNDILRLYRGGQAIRTQGCVLRYAPAKGQYRAAVVVSKKVSKSAVVRNRIRRRIYEQVRIAAKESVIAVDMVFVVHEESYATMPADVLAKRIGDLLKKARV